MKLRNMPWDKDFTFEYKGVYIHVPLQLNTVARYKPSTFWDWLLFKHTFDPYIELTIEHIIEEQEI